MCFDVNFTVITSSWEDVLEHEYALRLTKLCQTAPADQHAVDQLCKNPTGWSLAHYEQLAQLLSIVAADSGETSSSVGDVTQYIESVSVSSQSVCIRTPVFSRSSKFVLFGCK